MWLFVASKAFVSMNIMYLTVLFNPVCLDYFIILV